MPNGGNVSTVSSAILQVGGRTSAADPTSSGLALWTSFDSLGQRSLGMEGRARYRSRVLTNHGGPWRVPHRGTAGAEATGSPDDLRQPHRASPSMDGGSGWVVACA